MATTFDKAKERQIKKEKNKGKKKWRIIKFKDYVIPLYLLPLAVFIIPYYEIEKAIDKSIKWDEKKAKKILDKTLPKILEWWEEENCYYLDLRKYHTLSTDKVPFIYKRWARRFRYNLTGYLIENYQNDLYIKKVEDDYDWHHITFTENF